MGLSLPLIVCFYILNRSLHCYGYQEYTYSCTSNITTIYSIRWSLSFFLFIYCFLFCYATHCNFSNDSLSKYETSLCLSISSPTSRKLKCKYWFQFLLVAQYVASMNIEHELPQLRYLEFAGFIFASNRTSAFIILLTKVWSFFCRMVEAVKPSIVGKILHFFWHKIQCLLIYSGLEDFPIYSV